MHTNQLCYIIELNVFATCFLKRITLLSSDTIDVFFACQERVVRKVDSAIYRTVIFSTAEKDIKSTRLGMLSSQEIVTLIRK